MKYYNTNFHSDRLLDNDVREEPLFWKKKHLARTIFTHPKEETGSMDFGNIFRVMSLPKISRKN